MTNAPLLLVVAMLNAGEELSEARRAFAEGRYAEAEALAERAAQSPPRGGALYLVGLARFRAGRPAEALEALDAAGRAEDAPEPTQWSFNRGACLYALGRFEEAERAFADAGANESLARLAWVNAGFAALDAGAPERAAQWAERARPGASEQELAQVEQLRAEAARAREPAAHETGSDYARALESFDAGRFDEAHTLFLQAERAEPESGRARLMAGAASYRAQRRDRAREELTGALSLRLEPAEARIAREYLDRLSFGLRARGPGLGLLADAGGGYDSNVFQVGVASRDVSGVTSSTQTGSLFLEAGLGALGRLRLSDTLFAELSYGGSQRVYSLATAQDYSLQLHHVGARVEWEGASRWRAGAGVGADVFFTGLSSFRGLQASATGTGWAALDESARTSTRLEVSFTPKRGLGSEFDYLSGQRLDAGLSQEVRGGRWALVARYQYRADLIGTLEQTAATDAAAVSQTYVIPYAWRGHSVGASLGVVPWGTWEARLDTGVEWRRYEEDSVLRVRTALGPEADWGRRRREDLRGLVGTSVGVRLARPLRLSARYDLLVNTSNVDTRLTDAPGDCAAPDFVCHRYDYTNGNYQKHQGQLVLDGTW